MLTESLREQYWIRYKARMTKHPALLQLRFGAGASPLPAHGHPDGASHASPAELDVLLGRLPLRRFKTLEIVVPHLALTSTHAASIAHVMARLPKLESAALICTGTPDVASAPCAIDLSRRCTRDEFAFGAEFLLNEDADALEALAHDSAQSTFSAILEASRRLRASGLMVRWLIPIAKPLVYRLEPLFSLARDEGVDPVLIPHGVYPSPQPSRPARAEGDETDLSSRPVHVTGLEGGSNPRLDAESRLFLWDFITYRLLDEERHLHSRNRRRSYRALAFALSEETRGEVMSALRTANGDKMSEGVSTAVLTLVEGAPQAQWVLTDAVTPRVADTRQPAGHLPERLGFMRARVEQTLEVAGTLVEGGYTLARWACARLLSSRPDPARRLTTVLLIGAYGGEHIGDAAILGGVLLRVKQRYGATRAILMSQRPRHSRHLLPMLDTAFTIEVEAYERSRIRERIAQADAVVFAGGPLIDLPKQLVKHLYTVSLARSSGKPFIAEGIGPGPFPRRVSEWTARRIVCSAERISVRTSSDTRARVVHGLQLEVGHDPAFDYLATRRAALTRMPGDDSHWIERLLRETEGRLLIGLNVRPIRHLFTAGVPSQKRMEHTQFIERRFEARLAQGMKLFHDRCSRPPCFIFFPMNAIQFGSSDLRSAYRLQRILSGSVDMRVWQADASLDGVLALLRRLDVVITMRFHATIFALAEERRVIGIDYRIGKRDKVGALLEDFGQDENCRRIDELTSEWLFERLVALSNASGRIPEAQQAPGERTSPSAPNI
jgi:polysaccharide pyruvyl transferase WcaK-like protein